jgi:hypothetical protein
MNEFVAAETNKTTAIMIQLLEHHLGHGHAVSMDKFVWLCAHACVRVGHSILVLAP